MAILLHDDFAGAAGVVAGRVAETGQTWSDTNDTLRLDGSGRLIRNPASEGSNAGSYAQVSIASAPTYQYADISFSGTSSTISENGSVVLISAADPARGGTPPAQGIFVNALHAIFGRWAAAIAVWENNAALPNLITYTYPGGPLALDGTVYRIGVYFDGNRIACRMPDGAVKWAGDSRLSTYTGRHLIYQTYNVIAPNLRPRIDEVWADNDPVPESLLGYRGGRELVW